MVKEWCGDKRMTIMNCRKYRCFIVAAKVLAIIALAAFVVPFSFGFASGLFDSLEAGYIAGILIAFGCVDAMRNVIVQGVNRGRDGKVRDGVPSIVKGGIFVFTICEFVKMYMLLVGIDKSFSVSRSLLIIVVMVIAQIASVVAFVMAARRR